MAQQLLIFAPLLFVVILSSLVTAGTRKHVIIHVPLHIKHHHHTHTIYKHVKHHDHHHHDHHHDHHHHQPHGPSHDSYKLYSYSLGHRHAPPADFAPSSDEWGPTYGRASYEGAFPPGPYDEGFDGGNSYESNGFGGYGGGWEDK